MPVAPTISSRCMTSAMVRMPVVCHELMTFGVSVVLPIQLNSRTSNLMPAAPVAWCTGRFCVIATATVLT